MSEANDKSPRPKEYEQGWNDAFDVIADYVEEEVCMVTGSMIRRMRYEGWRYNNRAEAAEEET